LALARRRTQRVVYAREDVMDAHAEVADQVATWVLDACDETEAATVEAHLRECADCEAEAVRLRSAAGWIGAEQVVPPPARLRHAVLTRAREVRRPSPFRTLTEAYAGQVARLEKVLTTLAPADWQRSDPRHGDLAGMVAHLAGNDALVVADIGLRPIPAPDSTGEGLREAWRSQADLLIQGLVRGGADLDRPARLAGRGEPHPSVLRDALIQRAFETWTHLDDVGAMIGRPQPAPSPEQLRRIINLAVGLLPKALRHHGIARPSATGRLVLAGAGGGEWTFPLGADGGSDSASPQVALTIGTTAVGFAKLVANRHSPETLQHTVTGDRALATQLLQIARTLGCD
jgi:hypothetical protein